MRHNPERFPAGTRADLVRMNKWTSQVVDLQKENENFMRERIAQYDLYSELATKQSQASAQYLLSSPSLPSGNRLRDRGDNLGGTCQHDIRYGQIVQTFNSVEFYDIRSIQVSKPTDVGGTKIWDESWSKFPCGKTIETESASSTQDVYVRLALSTTRLCNMVVWEPYPYLTFDLVSVTLLGNSLTGTEVSLSNVETELHGPQRFFFVPTPVWGVEIKMRGTSDVNKQLDVGAWKFQLGKIGVRPSGNIVYKLSDNALSSATAHGEGNLSVALNTPSNGQVTISMTTPINGPTSVVRRIDFS